MNDTGWTVVVTTGLSSRRVGARERLLGIRCCGLQRQGCPGCTGVGRAVEAAPVRAGVEDMRIARAHREGADVQRSQSGVGRPPGLSAVETFPDAPGPS